jgi:anti-sigma B factor antagonist
MNFQLQPVGPPAGSGGTVPAVEIRGDVDAANATDLSNALRELASSALIIDLSFVDYFDSAGFAMLDRLLDEAPVVVVISPDCVMRPAAELLNLPFHDSLTDARASMEPALTSSQRDPSQQNAEAEPVITTPRPPMLQQAVQPEARLSAARAAMIRC